MPEHRTEITDNGGLKFIIADEGGNTRSTTLDPNLLDDLRLGALADGGFEVEFPDGEGGRLVLQFIPDVDNTQLVLKGGRPGGTLLSTTVNFS